jgi:uncharacterized membrane protein
VLKEIEMTAIQRSWGQIVLLILSIAGAGIAIYLTTVHYAHVSLVCSAQGFVDCQRVLSSPYSVVPGTTLPITLPGLFWCVVSAALVIAIWRWPERYALRIAQCAWTGLAMLSVLYLVYVELVRLHTLCAWCTGFHIVILMMLLISVVQLQQTGSDFEPGENEAQVWAARSKISLPRD